MKNAAQSGGILFKNKLLILVLALLVGDAAAGLAGRLAGGLALAAAAVLGALAQIAGLDGLNMLHGKIPPSFVSLFLEFTMRAVKCQSKNGTKHAPTLKLYHVFSFRPLAKAQKSEKNLCSLCHLAQSPTPCYYIDTKR